MSEQAGVPMPAPDSPPQPTPPVEGGEGGDGGETLLAGKFKTTEELVSAYESAQQKITELGQGTPPADPPADPPAEPGKTSLTVQPDQAGGTMQELFNKAGDEYLQTGEITAETRKSLIDSGFSESMVDTQLAGIESQLDKRNQSVLASTGMDEAEYQQMQGWAARSMTPEQLNAFNSTVAGRDVEAAKLAAAGLAQQYRAAVGRRVEETTTDTPAGDAPYTDHAEWMADMNNPEYQKSSKFQAMVKRRLAASPNLLK